MEFEIPHPLKAEHEELHNKLRHATQLTGKTGEAAKTVAKLLHPHFVKEEETPCLLWVYYHYLLPESFLKK